MKVFAIFMVLYIGLFYGLSIADDSGVDSSTDREDEKESCDADTWRPNTSIAISVYKTKNGEWRSNFVAYNKLRNTSGSMNLNMENKVVQCGHKKYLALSGYFKETDDDDFAAVNVGESPNNDHGQEDSYKRSIESATTADLIFMNKTLQENLMEARKSSDRIKTVEDRMGSFENTFNGTLTIVKNTLNSMKETIREMNYMLKRIHRCGCAKKFDATVKGKNIELYNGFRTAKRTRPTEDFGFYGGVVSNSVLEDDEVFQIKIEERIDEWSYNYGIGIGVIEEKEKNERIRDATGIYYSIKGTWGIYSDFSYQTGKCGTYKDGKTITRNVYPLQTQGLPVGTILGVSRRSDGSLHFYINGVDKGAAFRNVPKDVYAFVDVRSYVTKISIMS